MDSQGASSVSGAGNAQQAHVVAAEHEAPDVIQVATEVTVSGESLPQSGDDTRVMTAPGHQTDTERAPQPHVRVDARLLEAALLNLRKRVAAIPLVFEIEGSAEIKAERGKLLSQIDDYLLPGSGGRPRQCSSRWSAPPGRASPR